MVMTKVESLDNCFGYVVGAAGETHRLRFGGYIPLSAETGLGMNDLYDVLRPLPEEHMLKVIIDGRPNVGKSTLLNSVMQEDRVLVGPEAGLTRLS